MPILIELTRPDTRRGVMVTTITRRSGGEAFTIGAAEATSILGTTRTELVKHPAPGILVRDETGRLRREYADAALLEIAKGLETVTIFRDYKTGGVELISQMCRAVLSIGWRDYVQSLTGEGIVPMYDFPFATPNLNEPPLII